LRVRSGVVEALGVEIRPRNHVVVRAGKALPLTAVGSSNLELTLGENASAEPIEPELFPEAWRSALRELVAERAPSVAVLGGTDSGKTTFCTMLANAALRAGLGAAFIDGDVGQAELAAPTTVSMILLRKQVTDLFPLTPDEACFVGATSPAALPGRLIEALEKLYHAAEKRAGLIVLNLDGWVEGPAAVEHKTEVISRLRPQVCVVLQPSSDLYDLTEVIGRIGCKVLTLPVPPLIRKRSREERRRLRQLGYRKELGGSSCRTIRLGQIRLTGAIFGGGAPLAQGRLEQLSTLLGRRVLYGEEQATGLTVVVDEHRSSAQRPEPPPAESAPEARMMPAGFERGLLAGLLGRRGQLLSLGLIEEIDYTRGVIRVLTRYKGPIDAIELGQVRLDRDCRELT